MRQCGRNTGQTTFRSSLLAWEFQAIMCFLVLSQSVVCALNFLTGTTGTQR